MVKEVKKWTDSELNAKILSTADEVRKHEEINFDKEEERLVQETSDDTRIWKFVGAACGALFLGALFVIGKSADMPIEDVTFRLWTGVPLFLVGVFVAYGAAKFISNKEKVGFTTVNR